MIADEQTITSERITQLFNDLVRPIRDWFEQVTPEPTSAVAWFPGYSALVPRRVDTIPSRNPAHRFKALMCALASALGPQAVVATSIPVS